MTNVKAHDFSLCLLFRHLQSDQLHALTARHPQTRYSPFGDAKLNWVPLSNLPVFIADFPVAVLLPVPKGDRKIHANQVGVANTSQWTFSLYQAHLWYVLDWMTCINCISGMLILHRWSMVYVVQIGNNSWILILNLPVVPTKYTLCVC